MIIPKIGQWVSVNTGSRSLAVKVACINIRRGVFTGDFINYKDLVEPPLGGSREFSLHRIEEIATDREDVMRLDRMLSQCKRKGRYLSEFQKVINSRIHDCCVLCQQVTAYLSSDPVEARQNYIEGAGQLCQKCAVPYPFKRTD